DVSAAAVHDLLGDLFLATHGVNGHQSAVEVQQLQQLGNGRDFVGLLVQRDLPQGQLGLAGPSADDMQRPQPGTGRATQGLTVDGNVTDANQLGGGMQPGHAAALEGAAVERGEDTLEGVVAGDAFGQLQEASKPLLAFVGELGNVRPVIAVGDDG